MRTLSLLCAMVAFGTACAPRTAGDGGTTVSADASPVGAGTRVAFAWVGELTVVDIQAGSSETYDVPELAPGDPPIFLLRRGNHLVFWGGETYALDSRNLTEDPDVIADDSWFFVPSASPGRVWIVERDPARSTATHFVFSEVREINAQGEVTAKGPALGEAWMEGAVEAGVVFATKDDLVVWNPVEKEIVRRFGQPPMAAAHGNLVVWCRSWCPELHMTDVRTGATRTIEPPPGYDRFDGWDGQFTPDGDLFAVPVGNPPRYEGGGAAAIIDIEEGKAQVVPGSEEDSGIPSLTWDVAGIRLFLVVDNREGSELRYFDQGSDGAETAPVSPPTDFFAMAPA
jgi:hypothetical protein